MKYVATIGDTIQTGPDTFEPTIHVYDVTEETTVGELLAWHKTLFKYADKVYGIVLRSVDKPAPKEEPNVPTR